MNFKTEGIYRGIRQYVEFQDIYKGQYVTASIKVKTNGKQCMIICSDGVSFFIAEPFTTSEFTVIKVTGKISEKATMLYLHIESREAGTTELEVQWAKLELGSVATPFVPQPYGEELALCQRYCRKLKGGYPLAFTNSNTVAFQVFDNDMRTVPIIKLLESIYSPVYNIIGGGNYAASDFTILNFDSQGRLYTTKNNLNISDATIGIGLDGAILDAEIY